MQLNKKNKQNNQINEIMHRSEMELRKWTLNSKDVIIIAMESYIFLILVITPTSLGDVLLKITYNFLLT